MGVRDLLQVLFNSVLTGISLVITVSDDSNNSSIITAPG